MPPKKKSPPLHVSRYHIEQERRNVQLRTAARIATLLASSDPADDARFPLPIQQTGLSLNVIVLSFCSLLLTLNLVFLLWAYIEVTLHTTC